MLENKASFQFVYNRIKKTAVGHGLTIDAGKFKIGR